VQSSGGSTSAACSITARGIEKWEPIADVTDTWSDVTAVSDTWSDVAAESDTWSEAA
jgi:hypothetical protein